MPTSTQAQDQGSTNSIQRLTGQSSQLLYGILALFFLAFEQQTTSLPLSGVRIGASPSFEIPIHPAWPSAPLSEFTKLPIERHFAQALEGVACPMFPFESSLLSSAPFLRWVVLVISIGSAAILARTGLLFPHHFRLRRKGLDFALAGQPVEAEKCVIAQHWPWARTFRRTTAFVSSSSK